MDSFYATTYKTDCLQILYKFCRNWVSVPNIVHQLTLSLRCNHWKIENRGDSQDAINSIRWSAAKRLQANDVTSVFYDVIPLESVRGRSNVLIEGHFVTVLGNLNPKMLRHWLAVADWLIELGFNGTFSTVRLYRACLQSLAAKRRILFIASGKIVQLCILQYLQRNDSVSWCTIFGTEIQFLQNLHSICRQSVLQVGV